MHSTSVRVIKLTACNAQVRTSDLRMFSIVEPAYTTCNSCAEVSLTIIHSTDLIIVLKSSLCGAIGQRVRLLTERLVVQAHPGTFVLSIPTGVVLSFKHSIFCFHILPRVFMVITILKNVLNRKKCTYPRQYLSSQLHDSGDKTLTFS